MKVTVENKKGLNKDLKVFIDKKTMNSYMDKKYEETTDEWKKENLKIIKNRLKGWQLESFEESYTYKIENGISLFKKNLKNE